jgi:hypothetical protein
MCNTAYRSEKQIAAMNSAATINDPTDSILRFANKKGSPKSPKCSLSSAFMPSCGRSGRRWGVEGCGTNGFQGARASTVEVAFDWRLNRRTFTEKGK